MKKFSILALILCLTLICFAGCTGENEDSKNDTSSSLAYDVSLKVPQEDLSDVSVDSFKHFTAIDLAGQEVDSSIFKNKKLTMINIWATFCGPCINEMPDLEKLHQDYADKGFQIIGIVSDVTSFQDVYDETLINSAIDIVESTGVTYINLLPSDSLNKIKLSEVYSVPETIFVDENGKIVGNSYIGSRSYEDWQNIIDKLLNE